MKPAGGPIRAEPQVQPLQVGPMRRSSDCAASFTFGVTVQFESPWVNLLELFSMVPFICRHRVEPFCLYGRGLLPLP